MYIVLFATSGAASCPRVKPVEKVQELEVFDIRGGDLVESAEARTRVVLRGHGPLAVVWLILDLAG